MRSKTLEQKIGIISRSHLGLARKNQEDNHIFSTNIRDSGSWLFYAEEVVDDTTEPIVLMVADGMGGLEMGEVASEIARETTKSYCIAHADQLTVESNLQSEFARLFEEINQKIVAYAEEQGKHGELGTTLLITFITGKSAHVFWIGDSRCYLVRHGRLIPVSKDHSYVQELVDQGKITYEQSFYHPESNVITKYMGDPRTAPVPSYTNIGIEEGDILLLCSDGLNGMLLDKEIEQHFYNHDNLIAICESLIDSANAAGGSDNNTVILAAFGDFAAYIPEWKPAPAEKGSTQSDMDDINYQITPEAKEGFRINWKSTMLFFLLGYGVAVLTLFIYIKIAGVELVSSEKDQNETDKSEQEMVNAEVLVSEETESGPDRDALPQVSPPSTDTFTVLLSDYPEIGKTLSLIQQTFKQDTSVSNEVSSVKTTDRFKNLNALIIGLKKVINVLPEDHIGNKHRADLDKQIQKLENQ